MDNPHGIPPSELVRQQIFHMLRRISSYTAWKRILGYFQQWADITQAGVKAADEQGLGGKSALCEIRYASILRGLAHFDEGVRRLRQGDKRVFQYNAHGEFVMAFRVFSHWSRLFHYIETGDSWVDQENTPLWQEFSQAFKRLAEAVLECSPDIVQRQYLEADSYTFYHDCMAGEIAGMTFPEPLPAVPEPAQRILVRSGRNIPCTGIWEPVEVPASHARIWSLFKKPPPPAGPLPIAGTMAYLHGGSHAPMKVDATNPEDGIPTTWNLLWKDDRYEDGTIPEEEKDYVFRLPAPVTTPAPAPAAPAGGRLVVLASGQRTPVAGRWLLQDDLDVSIALDADHPLPLHEGRAVHWVLALA